MTLWNKSTAELTSALKTARGAKRKKILRELQTRWEEMTPQQYVEYSGGYSHIFRVPRFNFELCCQ